MIHILRLKQRSLDTEKAYIYWLRMFCRFMDGSSPFTLDDTHIKDNPSFNLETFCGPAKALKGFRGMQVNFVLITKKITTLVKKLKKMCH